MAIVFAATTNLYGQTSDTPVQQHIAQWVGQLGATDFDSREQATAELLSQGEVALSSLRAVPNSAPYEVRHRARLLQQQIEWLGDPVEWDERSSRRRGGRGSERKSGAGGSRSADRSPDRSASKSEGKSESKTDGRRPPRDRAERPAREEERHAAPTARQRDSEAGSRRRERPQRELEAASHSDGDHPFGGEEFIPAFLRN